MALANCSHCHRSTELSLRQSIHVGHEPELKEKVRDGSLFVWECPYCGTRNLALYQTLYHDPDARLMVWLLPEGNPPRAVSEAVKDLEGYTLRIVREAGDLVEKVRIHDAGLDDCVVEICKWVTRRELAEKKPSALDAKLHFVRMEGADNELLMALSADGQMQVLNIGFNVYEDARGILSRNPSLRPAPGFVTVDADWLSQFLG